MAHGEVGYLFALEEYTVCVFIQKVPVRAFVYVFIFLKAGEHMNR